MTTTIWKEVIGDLRDQSGYIEGYASLPGDAQVLRVDAQENDICVWFTCDASGTQRAPRKFVIVPTGGVVPTDASIMEYRSTIFIGPLVFHVYMVEPF